MHHALYRSYRPEVFEEMLGQEHIVRILTHQLETDTVGHAYLLCGTRGTGKTTTARILAKGVNCLSDGKKPCGVCENCIDIKNGTFIDVIEIDAASNNGVENIRELRENVKYQPAAGRKKVYIIDEVHMLSTGAFNALLKTLEEPPEHVMFILATTEPQKLPATILSRCMRLDFKRVSEKLLKEGMRDICEDKGVEISDAALGIIAINADGSVRDCLSLLDQCLADGKKHIERDDILELLGTPSEEIFIELTHNVAIHNTSQGLVLLDSLLSSGKEIRQLMKDWLAHYRALLISKFVDNPEDMLNMSYENVARIKEQADTLDIWEINTCIMELSKAISDAKWSTQPRILLELAIVKMSSVYDEVRVRNVNSVPVKKAEPVKRKEVPEKAGEEKTPQKEMKISIDADSFWRNLLEQVKKEKPALIMMGSGASLAEINDEKFIIATSSEIVAGQIKESRELIEEAAERITGVPLKMKLEGGNEDVTEETSIDELAKRAGDVLGLNIEIE